MNFGKCHQYLNPMNPTYGIQCKCFIFRATENNEYVCACCDHDRNYHEPLLQHFNSTSRASIPSIPTSIHSIAAAQDAQELNIENFELNIDDMITRVSRKNKDFKVINVEPNGPNPKIPRGIKKLERDGKAKTLHFDEDSSTGIKNVIEDAFNCLKDQNWAFFRCNSTSELKITNTPANIEELKGISGSRKKIYIGIVSVVSQQIQQIQPSNPTENSIYSPVTNSQPVTNYQPAGVAGMDKNCL
ncbi:hypothetical protein GLOIN_2v1767921 [Rhizophagus clarus]|uniref:Uncharacterized protein n=1 Tax=Rhizophagus clarus TaxID=94130 RepID=A0A8H3LI77_9GLOM|nr:hypothetical protein GLOIN_2v1767921 [Rhizophagus clarus]